MAEGYAYWRVKPASLAELGRVIAAHWPRRGPVYRWQEKLNDGRLEEVDAAWQGGLLADPPTADIWPRGRVFHAGAEVRWEATDAAVTRFQVYVLQEQEGRPAEGEWESQAFAVDAEQDIYLWGERKKENEPWIETRIPHPLDYPVAWSQRKTGAALRGRCYRQHGIVRLTRLTDVQAVALPRGGGR